VNTLTVLAAAAEHGASSGEHSGLIEKAPMLIPALGIDKMVVTQWVIVLVLAIIGIMAGRAVQKVPRGGLQGMLELLFDFLEGWLAGFIGDRHYARKYMPLFGTFILFIVLCNYTALFPFAMAEAVQVFYTPTSFWGTTAGLALCTAIGVQVIGIREQGFGHYMKGFLGPQPGVMSILMGPLTLLEELIHPFSLSLRLFGNVFAEDTLFRIVFGLAPVGIPIMIMFLMLLFGTIQAIVFATLSAIYIGTAIHGHDH